MEKPTLVFLLHGYSDGPKRLSLVADTIRTSLGNAEVITPDLRLSRISWTPLNRVIAELLRDIDEHWSTGKYGRVVLVGHSCGALLARKLYIAACGSLGRAPLEPDLLHTCTTLRPWAGSVERLVLLAGMNNGWSIDYHMSPGRALHHSLGVLGVRALHFFLRRWPTIFEIRRGSPFLTQLRIQWLLMRRAAQERGVGGAIVVQLLGTIDDMVSPRDNIDLVTGADFFFLDVPNSGHSSVLKMDASPEGQARAAMLKHALTANPAQLRDNAVPIDDVNPVAIRNDVTEVVFVIHGIRDEGFWTDKIAREILTQGREDSRVFARETSTYGYFGMLPFLSPWQRRRKVEWFMNRYAEAIARYPNVEKFHYVGHSNGTYLLARALQDYPCCQFNRIVFAGSVVPSRYDWKTLLHATPPQAREILNYAATADWVVAFFPSCYEYLGLSDIGGAGYRGFVPPRGTDAVPQVANVRYVVGEHSAAIKEGNWKAIARFIVHGSLPGEPLCAVPTEGNHARRMAVFAWCPPLVWLMIFAALISLPVLLVLGSTHYHWREWLVTSLLIAYFSSVWYVGNRV